MGLFMNNEMMQWLDVSLLGSIVLLLLILIVLVRRVIALLDELKTTKLATGYQSVTPAVQAEGMFEEDLAVIMALMAQKFPGIRDASIQVRSIK